MKVLWPLLLPELREFEPAVRDEELRSARETPLDLLELLGMALGMVAVTVLTRHAGPTATAALMRASAVVLNFAVAFPLLAVVLAPFHIRRLRRGLRSRLRTRPPR